MSPWDAHGTIFHRWRVRHGPRRSRTTMSLTRVQSFSVSLDGFGTGEGQSLDTPFGHAGQRLHQWMVATRFWGEIVDQPGGSSGIDNAFARQPGPGIGAEIVGAGKFAPPGWQEPPEWRGWGAPTPP